MADIIEKAIKAGEPPPFLRRLSVNGFTEEFEAGVLTAEKETENGPFRPSSEVLKELKAAIPDES
jgi:hypothetical protein